MKSKESIKKRSQTLKNNIPQVSNIEEREAHIAIDYFERKIRIYTNNATVINRMARKNYKHTKEEYLDKQVYSRTYEFDFDMLAKFATATIFK